MPPRSDKACDVVVLEAIKGAHFHVGRNLRHKCKFLLNSNEMYGLCSNMKQKIDNALIQIPPGLDHGVCLGKKDWEYSICQSGQPGALCLETSDCVVPPGLEHGVCRDNECQTALVPIGEKCCDRENPACADANCAVPPGLTHGVCLGRGSWGYLICQSGQPGAMCDETSDCVVPPGLEHAVCRPNGCQSGQAGAICGRTSDCVPIAGLNPPRAVCREAHCQQ